MGLVLMGGALLLCAMVWKKISADTRATQVVCAGGELDLRGQGFVSGANIENRQMHITLEKQPGVIEVLTIDPCSGQRLGSLTIRTDVDEPPAGEPASE